MIATLPTQERVDEIARQLAPDVVRIRFRIGRDWSDNPAIRFRVILTDEASRRDRLRAVTTRVEKLLKEELGLEQSDHIPYFRFRNQSEQAALKEEAWE